MSIDTLVTIFHILSWWQWAVGALGLAGAAAVIALLVFGGPWIAIMIGKTAADWIGEVLATRLGAVLIVGGIATAIAYASGSIHTAHVAANVCAEKIQKLNDAQVDREGRIADAIRKEYDTVIAARDQREADRDRLEKSYELEIASLAAEARCQLGPGPLRLRNKSGGSGKDSSAPPAGSQGVGDLRRPAGAKGVAEGAANR